MKSFLRWITALAMLGELPGQLPKAPPEELPPNVEKIVIKTASSALREIPFYLRVPKDYHPAAGPHRVLLICPVHNGDAFLAITGKKRTERLIAAADERQWFIITPHFKQQGGDVRDRKTFYYYPETFSGKAVLAALEEFKRKYPSLDTEALLLQGYSGGAQFVHRFAIWAPERVVAVAVNSTSWFDASKETSRQVAWLVTIGESDRSYDHTLLIRQIDSA